MMDFRASSETHVAVLDGDEAIDAVEDLAVELEAFAFERERVLAKLDIRSAAQARRTARDLRVTVALLPRDADQAAHDERFDALGELLGRAHTLLEGERAPAPGRPAEVAPPPSRHEAKTTPPPSSMTRHNSRGELDLDLDHDHDRPPSAPPGEVSREIASDPDLPAVLLGTVALLDPRGRTAAPAPVLPYFGDDESEMGFEDETVARKVCWERSGNRLLGR